LKDVHPRFRKLSGVGPVAPVLLHQSRLSTAVLIAEIAVERERDDEDKIHCLRKWKIRAVTETKEDLVESREKCLWASVNKQGQEDKTRKAREKRRQK
jgi:hypothetical protein